MRKCFLAVLAATFLAGCDITPQRWPWEKTVPITSPQPKAATQPAGAAGTTGAVQVSPGGTAATGGDDTLHHGPIPLTELTTQAATKPAPTTATAEEPAAAPEIHSKPLTEKPQVVAQSAVQVNDQFVTVEDVLAGGRARLLNLPAGIREDSFRRQARAIIVDEIRDQINDLLVADQAAGKLTDSQKEQVDKEMAEAERDMIAKAGGSRVHLEQMVLREGTTLERLLKEHRRRVEATIYVRTKFDPQIIVNRRMLWEYYQAHKDEFSTPKRVQMQTITAKYRKFLPEKYRNSPSEAGEPSDEEIAAAKTKARQQIDQAAASLKSGKAFNAVAKTLSMDSHQDEGGLWPMMAAGNFAVAKVESAAFEMKEGGVSDVIEFEGNFYIVKTAKVAPGEAVSFESGQPKIEDTLRRQQYRRLSEEYYDKLIQQAVIIQADDFVDRCLDRAVERYWGKNR